MLIKVPANQVSKRGEEGRKGAPHEKLSDLDSLGPWSMPSQSGKDVGDFGSTSNTRDLPGMMDAASGTCGGGARGLLRGRGDIAYPPNAADGRLPGSGRCRVEVNADGHVADDGPVGIRALPCICA